MWRYIVGAFVLVFGCCYGANAQPSAKPLRNEGTQVWLVPAPGGDLQRLALDSELWPEAQQRVDVLTLYVLATYHHEGFECGAPCGPNTYLALRDVVPESYFRWLSDRFLFAIEGTSVKPHACTEETVRSSARGHVVALDNMRALGATVSYLALDEPFASGLLTGACNLPPKEVARLQAVFNAEVLASHPNVLIGLIEPYPRFTPVQINSYLDQLERADARPAFFHLDVDLVAAVRERTSWIEDIKSVRQFCAAKGIPFGVIIMGSDGPSNESFAAGHWASARAAYRSVGVTEHTVIQSWAEDYSGGLTPRKWKPDTVPESNPVSHTGLLLDTLDFFGIVPSR